MEIHSIHCLFAPGVGFSKKNMWQALYYSCMVLQNENNWVPLNIWCCCCLASLHRLIADYDSYSLRLCNVIQKLIS
jgi:hypothetical protein